MTDIRINAVHYNARTRTFEARVDVIGNGAVVRCPCQVPGPQDMTLEHLAARIAQQALRLSDTAVTSICRQGVAWKDHTGDVPVIPHADVGLPAANTGLKRVFPVMH